MMDANLSTIVVYYSWAVVIVFVLTITLWILVQLMTHLVEKAVLRVTQYRRISWISYLARRLEAEGFNGMDKEYYRAVKALGRPIYNLDDAIEAERLVKGATDDR